MHRQVVDIGCGTGALCAALGRRGFVVTGVEPVAAMLRIAMRKKENRAVAFLQASVLEPLPFGDGQFDVAIATHVAHGLDPDERRVMYAAMRRIARRSVILYDYGERRSLPVDLVERMEGGDYFRFIREVRQELGDAFGGVRVLGVGAWTALYICRVDTAPPAPGP